MADNVLWIKMKVGMFDGESFKKIRAAKIGGESFRDKLTAVWFELMDFAGQCNHGGAFINGREIPYSTLEDIAVMINRDVKELELCMSFYIKEGMVEIIDDIYTLSNWEMYQNADGLERIREQTRERVARFRERQKQNALPQPVCEALPEPQEEDKQENTEDTPTRHKTPYDEVRGLYNAICTSYPQLMSMSEARKKAISARLKSYTIDDFRTVFEKAEASDFMKGANDRNWAATFDWMMKDSNFAKVLDGNYDNKSRGMKRKRPRGDIGAAMEILQREEEHDS